MAVKLNHGNDDLVENHEINVTPFIDVMLVLLIIFMIAAPLATVQVNVELPASTSQLLPRPDKPILFTVRADHSFTLDNNPVTEDGLAVALEKLAGSDKNQRVFLQADKKVDYETLMLAMNDLRAAGYLKIALVAMDRSVAE